jgi:hypothetical protein
MVVMGYQACDGLADYGFSLEFQADVGWRVYIIFQPHCQGDATNLQLPYQSIDRNGRCYVNWSSNLDSLGDAKTVAALWVEVAQRYQYTQEQKGLITKSPRTQRALSG